MTCHHCGADEWRRSEGGRFCGRCGLMPDPRLAALAEIEQAGQSLMADLLLAALSLDVMLAECRDALGDGGTEPHPREGEAHLMVLTRGWRS